MESVYWYNSSMDYRPLGRTGLHVSALSLGGVAFGDLYGRLDPGEADECVRRAIDLGVNLIDTSPYYGQTRSESVLGSILDGGLRDKIFLCSKAGRNGLADFDFRPRAIERSVESSLQRLRTDRLDVLIAHDIEFATDFDALFNETASVLHKLKAAGKCRFIGMSGLPLGILRSAIERCRLDVVISYTHYTLQNQRLLTDLLPVAESYGVGVMNASPLCMGLLSDHGPPEWHPAPEQVKIAAKVAADLCRRRGTSLASLAMQFCHTDRRIATTISGAALGAEIEANIRALETPIDQELLDEVQQIFAPVLDLTWVSGNWRVENQPLASQEP
jgi:L-galactose dehydrogenase